LIVYSKTTSDLKWYWVVGFGFLFLLFVAFFSFAAGPHLLFVWKLCRFGGVFCLFWLLLGFVFLFCVGFVFSFFFFFSSKDSDG